MRRHRNLITNYDFSDGDTGWTLGTGYSVVSSSYLLWDSVSDTLAESYQTVTVPPNTLLTLAFDFMCTLTDPTVVTDGVTSGALSNARVVLTDTVTTTVLSTIYIGESTEYVKRGCLIETGRTTRLKIAFIGAKAGTARFTNIVLRKALLPRAGQLVAPRMDFPSFKGGNIGEFEQSNGTDCPVTWLTAGVFTSENRAAWSGELTNVYLANNVLVARIFINIAGDYSANLEMFNADWSALNSTESTNLQTFFNTDVPDGMKIRVVFSRHTGIPDSVYNTSLEPVNAWETRAKWLARLSDAATLLLPYSSKIHSWEAVNEPNLNLGTDVSWGNIKSLLADAYTVLKAVAPSIPVAVSHQNQVCYMYPNLLLAGTSDLYDMHWYANQCWKTTASNTFLHCLPEFLDKPIIIGEWGAVNYTTEKDNLALLEPSYNLFYRLGFEHIAPWRIKEYADGDSMPDIAKTYEIPTYIV